VKYLVFGAAGSIGGVLVRQLLSAGHQVIAAVREHHEHTGIELLEAGAQVVVVNDVSDPGQVRACVGSFVCRKDNLDGVVYAVGHCPPKGFPEAIKYPLSQLPMEEYAQEIGMHQLGPLVVFQHTAGCVADGGCFVFMSSAITRLKGKPFPPFLHAHHHASVIGAGDWLMDGMREDPMVAERRIKIHRIAPAAVNTPFHDIEPRVPKMVSIATVAERIVFALGSPVVIDEQLVP